MVWGRAPQVDLTHANVTIAAKSLGFNTAELFIRVKSEMFSLLFRPHPEVGGLWLYAPPDVTSFYNRLGNLTYLQPDSISVGG
jgi:hypothetical protein